MDFKKKFNELAGDLKEQFNLDDLDLDKLLSDDFIKNNTTLESVRDFIDKSGFNVENLSDLKDVPQEKLDGFISNVSDFDSLKDMLNKAMNR